MQGWTKADVEALLTNPFYAVRISPTLFGEHEPPIDKATWVRANARRIEEVGAEAWLWTLLEVLEAGGVTAKPPRRRRRLAPRAMTGANGAKGTE